MVIVEPALVNTDFSRIDKPRKNKAVEYLFKFTDAFENDLMDRIEAGIRKSNYIPRQAIINIEKRMNAISIEQVNDPFLFFSKTFLPITIFRTEMDMGSGSIINRIVNAHGESLVEKAASICDFFERFGYMSPKQLNLLEDVIKVSPLPKSINTKIPNAEVDRLLNCEIWEGVCDLVVSKIRDKESFFNKINYLAKEKKHEGSFVDLINEHLRELSLLSKIKASRKEDMKDKGIPTSFLSLKEMRKALMYVG